MSNHKKVFKTIKADEELIKDFIKYKLSINPDLSRPRTITSSLKKLADYHYPKSLKDLKAKDTQKFFSDTEEVSVTSRDNYACYIISFYRWLYDLDRKETSKNMAWYRYRTEKQKRKAKDLTLSEKLLITGEEYKIMIDYSNDIYGQRKALWETYYLSGVRPEELAYDKNCNVPSEENPYPYPIIKDVKILNDGNVELQIRNSKSIPRRIPLIEYPEHLIRYLGNHPQRSNPESPLFFALRSSTELIPLTRDTVYHNFKRMLKDTKLKKTLLLKSFRKTRATMYFNNKEFTDTNIANLFGWTTVQVAKRRNEYDLSSHEELQKKIFLKAKIDKSYDAIVEENKRLKEVINSSKDGNILKKIEYLEEMLSALQTDFYDEKGRKYKPQKLIKVEE